MADRSFKDYIADHFYSEFLDAINDYIGEDIDKLGLYLSRVETIGDWEVTDLTVQSVTINDLPGMMIQFDAIVDAEFCVREADYHYDEDEEAHQWFLISCMGNLERDLANIQITKTVVYDQKNVGFAPMSDSLVPIIHSKDMEAVAEDFFKAVLPGSPE